VAIADTGAAAWAVAHHRTPNIEVVPCRAHREVLRSLPVEALRLSTEVVDLFSELEIRRIDQLLALPRSLLPARFGPQVLRRLDQALGNIAEPMTPENSPEPIEGSWTFEYSCTERRFLERAFEHLLEEVLAKLRPRQMGVQRLLCKLDLAGSEPQCLLVGLLHPTHSLKYLMELTRLHLDRIRLAGEVTAITVRVLAAPPLEFRQGQLFENDDWSERWRHFPTLVEVLSNRLGKKAVLRPRLQPEAQPELAWRYEPWLEQKKTAYSEPPGAEEKKNAFFRPLSLLSQPVAIAAVSVVPGGAPLRFEWGRRRFEVSRTWGPERIETGWWRGSDVRRDYYLVETTRGEQFWLFRALDSDGWFLHGTFE
jgi:protein ImuB